MDCGLCVVLIPICWRYIIGRDMILVSENNIVIYWYNVYDIVLIWCLENNARTLCESESGDCRVWLKYRMLGVRLLEGIS